ncbi:MAG TPA: hypothetical protein PKI19_07495 [Elusimicrobiales bacterium]|nr:hypothetical protein [Elusimicrobiales bacterium]
MKKYLLAVVTLAAFTGMSFAQAPAAAPAAAPVKAEKPVKKAVAKPEVTTGEISAIDAAANTITVKDAKGVEKTFTLEKVGTLAQGAKVKVTVKDGKTAVKEIKEHKKAEGKKAEAKKPEAKKAEAAK